MKTHHYIDMDTCPEAGGLRHMIEVTLPDVQNLADQGVAKGQFSLAEAYFRGIGVEKDLPKAAEMYRNAAMQGLACAQAALGTLYLGGTGVPTDYPEALRWLKSASAQADEIGLFSLGLMYWRGLGVGVDLKRGFRLFKRAAEAGLDEAQYLVGMAYAEGRGVAVDVDRAAQWLRDGAAQGHTACRSHLLLMKELGVKIPADAILPSWASTESANVLHRRSEEWSAEVAGDDQQTTLDADEGEIPDEYGAALLTIVQNYKVWAKR